MNFNDFSKRTNVNAIKEFLMFGGGDIKEPEQKTYKERLTAAEKEIDALLHDLIANEEERDTISNFFFVTISKFEDVYFEMGLLTGAKISAEMQNKLAEFNFGE